MIHEFGWKSRIRLAKVRTASGMSVIVGTWRRYSCRAVSRPAKPRCQPSIMASENAHPHAVAHVTQGTARHGSRRATARPHSTAATPMAIAGSVPQPTCAFHQPKIGAVCANDAIRAGVLLIKRRDDAQVQVGHHEGGDHQHHRERDADRLAAEGPHAHQH